MVTVAVAGGTGGIGRTLVEAILASGKHDVKVLSRTANPELEAKLKAPIVVVDYSDIEGLTRVLEENNVHTVISAMMMLRYGEVGPREIELIRAADASKTTKRMVSSHWGPPHIEEHIPQLASVAPKLEAQAELEKVKDLETTYVHNGFLLDYWGIPKLPTNMTPATIVLDIPNNAAAIPGSGDTPLIFTRTTDLAKFVTLMLDQQKWDPVTHVLGDRVTWNEFLRLAEEVRGTKFTVAYDSVEKLKRGETTELPSQAAAYQFFPKELYQGMGSTFGLWSEDGVMNFTPETSLNEQFPEVEAWKVKDFLEAAWGKSS